MTDPSSSSTSATSVDLDPNLTEAPSQPKSLSEPSPSFVKLAMRNMVRKGGKALFHFFLTSFGLLAALVGLAYLTR